MFDFRYHVVSLAAVFLALVFGILIGAGISGRGLVDEAERARLNADIAELQRQVEVARDRARDLEAAEEYLRESYEAVMHDRLAEQAIVVLFVGPPVAGVRSSVVDAITEAGGQPVRLRVLDVPVDADEVVATLEDHEELDELADEDRLSDVGRRLATELLEGGEAPLWDALGPLLVVERSGRDNVIADGVVVARAPSQEADDEATAGLLDGLYAGLAADVPAVAVETTRTTPSTVGQFRRTNLSSVDHVDRPVGRVALVLLLAGAPAGHYGVREGTEDALPPVEPAVRAESG